MAKQAITSWDAARSASRRPLRKAYRPVGPVYPEQQLLVVRTNRNGRLMSGDETCYGCNFHVCSCAKQVAKCVYGYETGCGYQECPACRGRRQTDQCARCGDPGCSSVYKCYVRQAAKQTGLTTDAFAPEGCVGLPLEAWP